VSAVATAQHPGAAVALAAALRDFNASRLALASAWLIGLAALLALSAPLIAPQNPYDLAQLNILDGRLPPLSRSGDGTLFLLGSDDQGRDLLSAMLYGLRICLLVALVCTVLGVAIGSIAGLMAAYHGGKVDAVLMRIVDIQLSFPAVLVALLLVALLGNGIGKVILAIVVVQWAVYARTVRAAALVERDKEYVEAARCLRYPTARILFGHILPNCLAPLSVVATVQMAGAISIEATLSFLGVGLPITEPSLGLLIANGYQFMLGGKYWLSVFPGLCLIALIGAINIVGDRLREVFNPREEH
jgi:peptide/nickel transport system permease protein